MEILKIIAMLCNLAGTPSVEKTAKEQMRCQSYYAKCFDEKRTVQNEKIHSLLLLQCVRDRK